MGEEIHYQHIGNKIRLRRIQLEITQEKMAEDLKISVSTYSKNEKQAKDIPLERFFHIAELLGISAKELISV